MVRPAWRKTGTAAALHRALLADRPEHLAAFLVDPDHPKVQALYESWGYRPIGTRQPFPDSPATPSCSAHCPCEKQGSAATNRAGMSS